MRKVLAAILALLALAPAEAADFGLKWSAVTNPSGGVVSYVVMVGVPGTNPSTWTDKRPTAALSLMMTDLSCAEVAVTVQAVSGTQKSPYAVQLVGWPTVVQGGARVDCRPLAAPTLQRDDAVGGS